MAVGIPAGARAGTYDVTLTAKLATGQTRSRTGKLTVHRRRRRRDDRRRDDREAEADHVLPKGLSAATARESGIAVLIGATKKATARVKLFQGTGRKNRRPKASKGVRLQVPGPAQVILKSEKLHAGPYRVVIRAGGRNFVRFGEADAVGEVRAPHRGARNPSHMRFAADRRSRPSVR